MKNLGRTIDRLINIDPGLSANLLPIKNKWERYPKNTVRYWGQVLAILNDEPWLNHPKRLEMQATLNTKRPATKKRYTFEEVTPKDNVLGVIPENISDLIKRLDRQLIDINKLQMEAAMTHDVEMASSAARRKEVHFAQTKKMWISLKDHFKLWHSNMNLMLRTRKGLLVLIELVVKETPQFVGPGIVKMDSTTLQKFLSFLETDQKPPME